MVDSVPTQGDESWVELKNGQPMPPLNQWVLVFVGKNPSAKMRRWWVAKRAALNAGHAKSYWETDTDEGLIASCVTHWKHLPRRPDTTAEPVSFSPNFDERNGIR